LDDGFCQKLLGCDHAFPGHEEDPPATPQRPKPELKMVEPLLMSATASSALLYTFELPTILVGACASLAIGSFLGIAALLPNRHPIVDWVPLTLLTCAVRGTREPILSTTLMRELTASDETEREREAIVLLEGKD
jgi:hypothetical protein